METSDVKRLKQLEAENRTLKKLVAERDLEIDVMKEIARKKWEGSPLAELRSIMPDNEAYRPVGLASCCRWPVRAFIIVRRKSKRMPRFFVGCVRWPIDTHVMATEGFKCFSNEPELRWLTAERIVCGVVQAYRCLASDLEGV